MKIKIKKLNPNAVVPKYAKNGDAGLDLTAIATEISWNPNTITYKTGLAIEIPEGFVGLIFPRSSVYKTKMIMANCVGVIDSGYRGEILAKFKMFSDETNDGEFKIGDRVAQLIIMPYPLIEFDVVDELSITERGEAGFGSSN